MKTLVIYPPCLDNPFLIYIGAREKDAEATKRWSRLKAELMERGVILASYICPETVLDGWPRPPAGMEEYVGRIPEGIVEYIKRIVEDVRPEKLVIIGARKSPVCGVTKTASGSVPDEFAEKFRRANMEERQRMKKEASKYVRIVNGPGALMETLIEEFPNATFIDFSKSEWEKFEDTLRSLVL